MSYNLSNKAANRNRAITMSAINAYNESITPDTEPVKASTDNEIMKNVILEGAARNRKAQQEYNTYIHNMQCSLVAESLYKLFSECISNEVGNTVTGRNIMRSIVSNYVNEVGYNEILKKMKNGSVMLSEMYSAIVITENDIRETIDKDNAGTFSITPEMRDEFFKQLNYSDSDAIADAIKERVSDAMNDFVTANAKDHEDITAALKSAQEKIASTNSSSLQESYEINAKRKINEIKSSPKNVFHAMVSAMCEGVIKHQDENLEFFKEGHLDIDKIAERTSIMYTFMEMLNTTKLHKFTTDDIADIIYQMKS